MNRRGFLVIGLAAVTVPRFALAQPSIAATPLQQNGALVIVTARVGGLVDAQVVLDTGAAVSVFTPEFAARIGLNGAATAILSPGKNYQGGASAFVGEAVLINFAGSAFKVSPAIADLKILSAALGQPVHGILGNDVFRDSRLIIDYARAEMRIVAGAPNAAIGPAGAMRFAAMPFVRAEVRIGHASLAGEFGLDTGLDAGVKIYRPRAQLAFPNALTDAGRGVTIAGEQTQAMGVVQSLILDGQDIGAVTANFAGLDKPTGASADYVGTIGAQAFLGRTLTIDYSGGWWSLTKG